MNRMAVGYAHDVEWRAGMRAAKDKLMEMDGVPAGSGPCEPETRAARGMRKAVEAAWAAEEELSRGLCGDYAKAMRKPKAPPDGRAHTGKAERAPKVSKAKARWAEKEATKLSAAARRAASERARLAAKLETVERETRAKASVKRASPGVVSATKLSAMITLLCCAALWGPVAHHLGSMVGVQVAARAERQAYGLWEARADSPLQGARGAAAACCDHIRSRAAGGNGSRQHFSDGWRLRERERVTDERVAACYAAYANPKFTGQPEPTVKIPSKLTSAKDGSQHAWKVGESFKKAAELVAVMDEHPETYAWGLNDLREVHGVEYRIELEDYNPVWQRQYHLARREQEFADGWVRELETAGLVSEVESPYAAPVVVAPKKDEQGAWTNLRYAVDYRRLNALTVRDRYPTPVAEEILARLAGAKHFTVCDAQAAFHQVKVAAECKPLLAFHAGNRLMTWNRMPFGGKNSVAVWQRVMDDALAGMDFTHVAADAASAGASGGATASRPETGVSSNAGVGAQAYADDVIIWSSGGEEEHVRVVRAVLARLRAKGIQLSPKKCKLGMRRVEFLGHIVSDEGVEPQWSKVEAINALKRPTSVTEVRAFLGMATYYCRFLDHYSHVKKPLTTLTRKDVVFTWGEE
jgi:hypothetical protein